jgi:hypothetical protein
MTTRTPRLLLALLAVSCTDDRVKRFEEPPPPEPRCGDGQVNGDEQCEGDQLGEATCKSLGFISGAVSCAKDCTFDTSRCSRTCGNGKVDPAEECDALDLKGARCVDWGSYRCGADCTLGRTGCVPEPYREAQRLSFLNPTYAAFGVRKEAGRDTGLLFVARPLGNVVEILAYDRDKQFDVLSSQNRKLALDGPALPIVVRDLNGDGSSDLVLRYLGEQKLTVKLSGANGFTEATIPLGCEAPLEPLAADLDRDKDLDLVVPVCTTDQLTASKVLVVRNDGGGTFKALSPVPLPEPTQFLRLVEGELYVQVPSRKSVKVLSWDGSGGFADKGGKELGSGEVPSDFVAAELNDDAFGIDLIVLDAARSEVRAILNKGDGTFAKKPLLGSLVKAGPFRPLDVDLDGVLDVALLTEKDLVFLKVSKTDLDVKRQALPLNLSAASLDGGDADLDGDPDFAVGGAVGTTGQVLFLKGLVR